MSFITNITKIFFTGGKNYVNVKKILSLSLIGCLSLAFITMDANAANTDDSNNSAEPSAINSDISAEISVENAATSQGKLSMLALDKLSNEQYQTVMEAAPTAYKSLEAAQSEQEKEEILAAQKIIVYT